MEREPEKSIGWVIGMVMLVIVGTGWCFLCSLYEGGGGVDPGPYRSVPRVRQGIAKFVFNGIKGLADAPAILGYGFREHLWLIITVAVLELVALFGGRQMKKLEAELNKERRR